MKMSKGQFNLFYYRWTKHEIQYNYSDQRIRLSNFFVFINKSPFIFNPSMQYSFKVILTLIT